MTREEILAQLRGIHLPPSAAESGDVGIAHWPLWTFLVLVLLFAAIRWWRQNAWRREARVALSQIEAETDPTVRWDALLDLSIRVARVRERGEPLPALAYRAPDTVADGEVQALAKHIRDRLGS